MGIVLASSVAPGLMSEEDYSKLASVPSGGLVAGLIATVDLNLLTSSLDNELAGTLSGGNFLPVSGRMIVTSINGTITTGPTVNLGNNTAKTNFRASGISPSATDLNTINTQGAPGQISFPGNVGAAALVDAETSFKLDITVAAVPNTATVCRGIYTINGFWYDL